MKSLRSLYLSFLTRFGLGLGSLVFTSATAFASAHFECIFAVEILSHAVASSDSSSFRIVDSIEVNDRGGDRCDTLLNSNHIAKLEGKETEVGKIYEIHFSHRSDRLTPIAKEKWEVKGDLNSRGLKFLTCSGTQASQRTVQIELYKHANNEFSVAISTNVTPRYYLPSEIVEESFSTDSESLKLSGNIGELLGYEQVIDTWTRSGPVTYQFGGNTQAWDVTCTEDSPTNPTRGVNLNGCYDATSLQRGVKSSSLSDANKICVEYTPNSRSGNYSFKFFNNEIFLNTVGVSLAASHSRCPNCYTFEGLNTKVNTGGSTQGINSIIVEYAGFEDSFDVKANSSAAVARGEDPTIIEVDLKQNDLNWALSLNSKYNLNLKECSELELKIGYVGSSASQQKYWTVSTDNLSSMNLEKDDIERTEQVFKLFQVQISSGGGYVAQSAKFRLYSCQNYKSAQMMYDKKRNF